MSAIRQAFPLPIGSEPRMLSMTEEYNNPMGKVSNDLINVLSVLASYKPADRNKLKQEILRMLKATGTTFLLVNQH